jgi:hypothetical protein
MTEPNAGRGAAGHALDWVLTDGADMSWHYAFAVQAHLTDLDAAYRTEDWALCMDVCLSTLRQLARCELHGTGIRKAAAETELELLLATDATPAGLAMRELPPALTATRQEAEQAIGTVRELSSQLRERLPVEMPDIRTPEGQKLSMRLSASLLKWRRGRTLAAADWSPATETNDARWR